MCIQVYPHKSTIDLWDTTTLNLWVMLTFIQISFIYSTMHLYPWQNDPTPSSNYIDLWSIGVRGPWYMCIFPYVKVYFSGLVISFTPHLKLS